MEQTKKSNKLHLPGVLLMLCLAFVLMPMTAHASNGNCGAGADPTSVTWTLDETTGLLTITGTGAMEYGGWEKSKVTSVEIENGVSVIGVRAFSGCTNLTKVTGGAGIETIGQEAFSGCEKLSGAAPIGNNVKTIGHHAFENCKGLTEAEIPDGVTDIGMNVFNNCTALKEFVVAPGNAKYSGNDAYYMIKIRRH